MKTLVSNRKISFFCWAAGALACGSPLAALDLIAKVGDPAPGFPDGTTITSFVEPPSINGAGYAALRVTVTGGVYAIYRWHRGQSLQLVARGTDQLAFATGTKTLFFLETPIVDDLGWVAFTATLSDSARGLVVWQPPGTLHPVAEIGQTVAVPCEEADFSSCDPMEIPPTGPLSNMATFNDRKAAVFRRHFDGIETQHEILFAGVVNIVGAPRALFRWAIDDDGGDATFSTVTSSFMHYPGSATGRFVFFESLAACDSFRYGIVEVSTGAQLGIVEFDPFGSSHVDEDRFFSVNLIPRKDFHCVPFHFAFAGARSEIQNDTDQTKRGVFIDGTQIYFFSLSSSGIAGSTIGAPHGQALTFADPPETVFAANFLGDLAGKAGVWRGGTVAPTKLVFYETQGFPSPSELVNTLWTVHVGGSGMAVAHAQMSTGAQAILQRRPGALPVRALRSGDAIPFGASGTAIIDSFWTLGGGFGADPVVTGAGNDGLLSALNDSGQFALLIYATPTAGPQRGVSTAGVFAADLGLFADDFESADVCAWSAAQGAPGC